MRKAKKRELKYRYKALISILSGMVCAFTFAYIGAIIAEYIDLPRKYSAVFGLLTSGIFSYVSGFIIGKMNRRDGIKSGMYVFVVSIIIMISIGMFLPAETSVTYCIIKFITMFILSQSGAIIGVNSKMKYY